MSALLYLPGLLVVLVQSLGILKTAAHLLLVIAFQALIAWPFLVAYPREYLRSAFDLSRQFLYKWTVNWRFLPEDVFLSTSFARTLLLAHVAVLVIFGFRWCQPEGGVLKVLSRALGRPTQRAALSPLTPDREYPTFRCGAGGADNRICIRHRNHSLHLKSYRNHLRPLIALSILFVVRTAITFLGMAYGLSYTPQVRLPSTSLLVSLL